MDSANNGEPSALGAHQRRCCTAQGVQGAHIRHTSG